MAVSISNGGPDDIDTAVSIYARASAVRRGGREVPDWRLSQIRADIRPPDTWLFLANDGGEAVAMASAMPSREDDGAGPQIPGLCFLDLLFVVPERWGEGIGALLLDTVMTDASTRGFSRIHLWTHDNNQRAHALYLGRGFARTGESRHGITDPEVQVSEWACPLEPRAA